MRTVTSIIHAAISLTLLVTTAAAAPRDGDLISVYRSLNELCRGGHGDDPSTDRACDARSTIDKLLRQDGYCHESEYSWKKCR